MRIRWLFITLIVLTAVIAISGALAAPGRAQVTVPTAQVTVPTAIDKPLYAPGEVLVQVSPTVDQNRLFNLCLGLNLEVASPLSLENTYLLKIKDGRPVPDVLEDLRREPGIAYAGPNHYRYLTATPNDARFNEMWGLKAINMTRAWDIQKGKKDIIVAVLDSGVSPTHPDLASRLLPGFNGMDGSGNFADDVGHGTHVAGTIGAVTDNGLGVAGVTWENVKILPVKVGGASGIPVSAIIEGIKWAISQKANVFNCSFGGPVENPLESQAFEDALKANILVVAAAGNDSNRPTLAPVNFPAALKGVIAVAASGPDNLVAFYSCAGSEVSVTAPGGSGLNGNNSATEILSTYWDTITKTDTYAALTGTSMASPHVAGVAALLLSEGAAPGEVRGLLETTATDIGAPGKDNDTGFGLINVYKALSEIGALIVIEKPAQNAQLGHIRPDIRARVDNFDEGTLKLYFNADPSADPNARPVDPGQYNYNTDTKILTYTAPAETVGRHFVIIEAKKGDKLKRIRRDFFLTPHLQPSGRTMFSVPYGLAEKMVRPEDLLGTTLFKLYRFIADPDEAALGQYAKYVPGASDPTSPASFTPKRNPADPLTTARIHGQTIPAGSEVSLTVPAGLGYWLDLKTGVEIPILVDGKPIEDQAYDLPLQSGWNLIGNPFTFPVDWSNVQVEYQGQSLTLTNAVSAGWLTRTLYRLVNSSYLGYNTPEGQLMPWEAHWVHALVPCTLVVPPVASTGAVRSEGTASRAVNMKSDSWKVQLSVRAGAASDVNNFAGVSSRAADGPDISDMRKPPMMAPYVSLDFVHSDWGRAAGAYMEDIRSPLNGSKIWNFQVATDQPNADVVISWPNISRIPGKYRFTLEDVDTGRKVFMGTQAAYTYNSGARPASRKFRLVARLSASESLMITGLNAAPARGQGTVLSYSLSGDATVGVEVITLTGKVVRKLASGAQSAGMRSAVWDNRDARGRNVPGGSYLMQVTAVGPDGQVVRAVQPATIR
ncbi:MAG: S8 family serine peptidase [Armatimonadetes bacterium]|nr:S8 family serine peptidase [Armatimonadota bacterium]